MREVDALLRSLAEEALDLVTAGREGSGQNPLLTKEGARGRLLTRRFKTSPDPSLVRRGTLDERRPALQTELRPRRQLHAALGAAESQSPAALEAKLGSWRIFVLA
jgi:hypothetical protein